MPQDLKTLWRRYKSWRSRNAYYDTDLHQWVFEAEIPNRFKRVLKAHRAKRRRAKINQYSGKSYDKRIYLHKYYPWCYRGYHPTLVLQGWYDINKAKTNYLRVYGPEALKYIRFIKGKEAIERDFRVGTHLCINGFWFKAMGKYTFYRTPDKSKSTISNRVYRSVKNNHNGPYQEKHRVQGLFRETYGRRYISEVFTKKRLNISRVSEINEERSRSVYEIPPEYQH